MKAPTTNDQNIRSDAWRVTRGETEKLTHLPKALSVLLTLSSIFLVAPVQAQSGAELPFFREDFEDGNATDGVPARWVINRLPGGAGSGKVVDGAYVLSTTAGRQTVWTDGSLQISDVSVRTTVRAMDDTDGTIMVVAHGQTDGRAYMGSIGDHGIALWESRGLFPIPNMINATVNSSFNPLTQDMNIQFDVVGRKMSLTAWPVGSPKPTTPNLTGFAGTLLPPGRVGINTGMATVVIQSIDAIRIGNSLPPAPTLSIQMHSTVVVRGTVGMHYRVEFRNGLSPDDTWSLLEDIPSLTAETYPVQDPTPVSSNPQRVYQVVQVP